MDTTQLRDDLRALADFYEKAEHLPTDEAQRQHSILSAAVGQSFKPFYDAAFAGELTWSEIAAIDELRQEADAGFIAFRRTHPERPQQ